MNKNIVYNFILIFIIIKCVKSQDNDPDQPSEDEEDEYNFDVSDLDEIIEEETAGFINPQYQPQYQQIEESQYLPQPQIQPQQYDYYQGETQEYQTQPQYYDLYQPESQEYQPEPQYQPEHQYYPGYQQQQQEPQQYQTESYGYYEPPAPTQQEQQEPQQYQTDTYGYYEPPVPTHQITQQPEQYQYYEPPTTQTSPLPQVPEQLDQYYLPPPQQQPEQYYITPPPHQPTTAPPPQSPTQPQYQYYLPPPQQPQEQYYDPYQPTQPTPQVPQQQYYEPPQPQPTQQSYPYYGPYQPSQPQHQYYDPPQPTQQQPSYQYYDPSHPIQPTQPQEYYEPPPTQPAQPSYQYYQPTQPQPQQIVQSETVEDDDNFYVTEHDQPQQEPSVTDTGFIYGQTQPTQEPIHYVPPTQYLTPPQEHVAEEPTQPGKRKRTRATSGEEDEEEEEERIPKKGRGRPIRKSKKLKFYKRNDDGNLEEMNENDYLIKYSDNKKKEYVFNTNLEQLECDDRIIYQHTCGTPYCSLLSHSKETDIFILTNSQGFTLVRKTKGEWKKNDYKIPENIMLLTQDFLGNEIIITSDQYSIHFTSLGSFKYVLLPGVKCCKIVVDGLVVWEKTYDDVGFPTIIYLSEQMTVTIKFEKYSKTFRKRPKYYKLLHIKKTSGKDRYS